MSGLQTSFDMPTKPTVVSKIPSRSRRTGTSHNRSETKLSTPVPVRRIRSTASSTILTNTPNSFTPITAHYSLNKTLHIAFYKLCEKRHFRTALSVGIQFCRVALFDIPQHSYYESPKYKHLKAESAKDALDVSELLPAIVAKVAEELKAKGNNQYEEKSKEVQLLKKASRDHCHSITIQSPSPFGNSVVKKEVLKTDDGFPSWLKVLDCGDGDMADMALNLCPPKNDQGQLVTVQENDVDSSNREFEERRHDIRSRDKIHRHQHDPKLSPLDFSRTTSAPAHLGVSHASQRRKHLNDTEMRDSPPVSIEENSPLEERHSGQILESKSKESLQYESDLERALYLSGLEFQPNSQNINSGTDSRYQNLKPVSDSDFVEIETLSQLYRDDFEGLRKNQVINVTYLNTYQGRVKESVNGCTVIAPLLAIHHLCDSKQLSGRNSILREGVKSDLIVSHDNEIFGKGIDDETVRGVIDKQAPLVLPRVRRKLGLPSGALIIPSDVHDFLIQENFFQPEQFAGVYGGNILDDSHISQFLDYFSTFGRREGFDVDTGEAVESRKVAAVFFFHEHVVSIHRVTRRFSTSFSHATMIDMPQKSGFFKKLRKRRNKNATNPMVEEVATITEENTWFEIIDSLPGSTMYSNNEDREQRGEEECYSNLPFTVRSRCNDKRSLHAALRWMACSKFTPDERKFVDSYQWDDKNMEFDPRVFQAFIWSDESSFKEEKLAN